VRERAVVDTGPLLAAFNQKDPLHSVWGPWLADYPGELVVPYPVLVETCWSLERWPRIEASLIQSVVDGELTLYVPIDEDLARIAHLVEEYHDLPLGIVDSSVVVTAERLGISDVASIDNHLRIVRPKHLSALNVFSGE